jgi:GINS complex subunit 4
LFTAPDILEYQGEIVELMMGQINHMEENLNKIVSNDFRRVVHKMELERIKYTIAAYLRCRLQKLEDFSQFMIDEEKKRPPNRKRLSEAELTFAEEFQDSIEKHFQQLALQHLPPQQDDISKRIIRPNIMSHVFLRVIKSSGIIVNTSDEEVDLSENSIHMLPYQLISELVNKGDVVLI